LTPTSPKKRRVLISADDFGLNEDVNEAIEIAHRDGILSTASLMVAGPAAADAIRRARKLPTLHVGLHLVAIEGQATLPTTEISAIVGPDGRFSSNQLQLGIDYFFKPQGRRALHREITAQYAAFAKTGLRLDHANAHKHMHLHPTVGRMMIDIGKQHGLPAIRIPYEPPSPLRAAGPVRDTFGDAALRQWCRVLRHQAKRAGLHTNDQCFGLAWSGHMTTARVTALARALPPGLSEIYFHPATRRDTTLERLMPGYDHQGELAALLSPDFLTAIRNAHVALANWDSP